MIADNIVADSYLVADLRRYIADDISAGLFILFDVDSEPDDHSEVLLLFVGCIVNFIVSYLICMFQDSVPAGSYNDPFLSSVCVCVFMYVCTYVGRQACICICICICTCICICMCMYMHVYVTYVCVCVCMCACVYVCMCVGTYIRMYVCMDGWMYVPRTYVRTYVCKNVSKYV